MISIVDYGMGNLASIRNMFKKVGVVATIAETVEAVERAEALVIPGVGTFDRAMSHLDRMELSEPLREAALRRKIPVLGICLGMQLMTRGSEEGSLPGFGWVDADCRLIRGSGKLRVPHMGWNTLEIRQRPEPYFDPALDEHRFYFVHSYAVHCDNPTDVLTTTTYGEEFVSGYAVDNVVGVQFHPEKSHKFGARFLRGFAEAWNLLAE